jgi:hypothetical protein
MSKEAQARIKINKLLEAAGWRSDQITEVCFFPQFIAPYAPEPAV